MRQPTFRRGKARQQRLIRTGIALVVLVAGAALIANLVGGDPERSPETPLVAFKTTAVSYSDAGTVEAAEPVQARRVATERRQIEEVLETWYQRTFIDPDVFSADDGAFPPADAMALVAEEARADVAADVDALTLGSLRHDLTRVEPEAARASITVLFEKGRTPVMAVADVTFRAVGTTSTAGGAPVRIEQTAAFHLQRAGGTWVIVYYGADQSQRSMEQDAGEDA